MKRILLMAAVALTAAFAVPAVASASTVTLTMPDYMAETFPAVYSVKATNLPKKTYGYAPRWLVAETIVGQIQYGFSERGRFPKTVHPQGARWDGGVWRVTYRVIETDDGAYGKFTVRKGRQIIQFDGGS